jgi:phage gpG-like protein
MIVTVNVNADVLKAALRGYPERVHNNVLRVVQRLAIEVQRSVKDDKLSGQVLHVRTGTLHRSINQQVTDSGSKVMAIIGTNVKYAGAHEYGFDGTVSVKEHVRRSKAQAAEARRTRKDGTTYLTRNGKSGGAITVGGHTRMMHMPERSFLRSTLKDFETRIRNDIAQAAREAWQE